MLWTQQLNSVCLHYIGVLEELLSRYPKPEDKKPALSACLDANRDWQDNVVFMLSRRYFNSDWSWSTLLGIFFILTWSISSALFISAHHSQSLIGPCFALLLSQLHIPANHCVFHLLLHSLMSGPFILCSLPLAHTSVTPRRLPGSSAPIAITFHLLPFLPSRSPKWLHSAHGGCLGSVNYARLSLRREVQAN